MKFSDRKEEITDDESDEGWITKKRSFHVKKYGNACVYIHKVFNVKKKTKESLFPDGMNKGKICAVVVAASNRSNYFFKIYDCEVYRHPPASNERYSYVPCTRLMTQDYNKLPVVWEKEELYGDSLLRRSVRQHFKTGWYTGRVTLYNSRTKLYTINYDDGDSETMNLDALLQALRPVTNKPTTRCFSTPPCKRNFLVSNISSLDEELLLKAERVTAIVS